MRKYWWLLILPIILLLWWGLGRGAGTVEVHVTTAKSGTLTSSVPTNGTVEPAEWSAARAETSGVVRKISVALGQRVSAGQVLVTLDTTAARADLAAAVARQQAAAADLSKLDQGGTASAVANLNDRIRGAQNAVQIAQRIYDEDKRLLQSQAATRLQVQTDADNLNRAKLTLEAVKNQKRTAVTSSDRTVASAQLHQAQQAVALAQHRVQLGEIHSPTAGTVYKFDLKLGAYLEPGALVAEIGDLDKVKVIVYVDEPDLGRVGLGMPVEITSQSRPGMKWIGRVDKLPTEVVPKNTRVVGEVSTIIDNPNHDLLPHVSVDATIISQVVKDAIVIPKIALRRVGTQDGVYRLEGDTLRWVPVKVGISNINSVQIVSGLRLGDKIADQVVDPSDAELRSGMRVKTVSD
ncbi:MAG TPA: efflux RND transporter periplasmic adaptor subunit [Bryobacteraceae bacterium]|jgi:HlyD family secretion protein|nr:efflux RND transporter periplasmic adaptor subunit [Bryobacteraceae bacterium]